MHVDIRCASGWRQNETLDPEEQAEMERERKGGECALLMNIQIYGCADCSQKPGGGSRTGVDGGLVIVNSIRNDFFDKEEERGVTRKL